MYSMFRDVGLSICLLYLFKFFFEIKIGGRSFRYCQRPKTRWQMATVHHRRLPSPSPPLPRMWTVSETRRPAFLLPFDALLLITFSCCSTSALSIRSLSSSSVPVGPTQVSKPQTPKWYSRQGSWHKTWCVCYPQDDRALAPSPVLYFDSNFFLS